MGKKLEGLRKRGLTKGRRRNPEFGSFKRKRLQEEERKVGEEHKKKRIQ